MYRMLSASAAVVMTALMFVPAMAQSITITGSAPSQTGYQEVRAMKVSTADVDLNTAQGATTLFDRIDAAARAVCGESADMSPARAKVFATCRARAVHYAVKEVDAPQLTQFAAAR